MRLFVDAYGSYIGKKENRITISTKEKKDEYSIDKLKQIVLTKAASISSDAVELAIDNNVDIVYLDRRGMPIARTYPCRLGGTTLTRRKQALFHAESEAAEMIKSMIQAKIRNQATLLRSLSKTREDIDFSKETTDMLNSLKKISSLNGKVDDIREDILGIEGYSGSIYFGCLSQILPFKEREHEAKDPFNCILNYGYGILYSEIEKACILAGLDPYLGFLHTDRYGKPSMVLDMIEEFRQPVVDRTVITLFAHKHVSDSDFEHSGNCLLLKQSGRKKVIEAIMEKLHHEIKYHKKKTSMEQIILKQARQVARLILGETGRYEPFIYRC